MKISLDCSSQLELVEVVRTEESLGSVQGAFRTFFGPLCHLREMCDWNPTISSKTHETQVFHLRCRPATTTRASSNRTKFFELRSLWVVSQHTLQYFYGPFCHLWERCYWIPMRSSKMPEIIAFPLIYKPASTARAKSNWSKLFELQGLIVVSQHSFKYFLVPFANSEKCRAEVQ